MLKLDYVPGLEMQIVVFFYLPIISQEILGLSLKSLMQKPSPFHNQQQLAILFQMMMSYMDPNLLLFQIDNSMGVDLKLL